MNWIESHMLQLVYLLDFFGQVLPVILAVAIIFTFFLIQSFAKKLTRMSFYLDRIDNHLREITYFIKENREMIPAAGRKRTGKPESSGADRENAPSSVESPESREA